MDQSRFSIRQVIELTGVSEYVLRAWELRYDAFSPKRTDTGRRLYSKNDLEKAKTLWELTQKGHKISEVAPKSLSHLKELLNKTQSSECLKVQPNSPKVLKILESAQKFEWDDCRVILLAISMKSSFHS